MQYLIDYVDNCFKRSLIRAWCLDLIPRSCSAVPSIRRFAKEMWWLGTVHHWRWSPMDWTMPSRLWRRLWMQRRSSEFLDCQQAWRITVWEVGALSPFRAQIPNRSQITPRLDWCNSVLKQSASWSSLRRLYTSLSASRFLRKFPPSVFQAVWALRCTIL